MCFNDCQNTHFLLYFFIYLWLCYQVILVSNFRKEGVHIPSKRYGKQKPGEIKICCLLIQGDAARTEIKVKFPKSLLHATNMTSSIFFSWCNNSEKNGHLKLTP